MTERTPEEERLRAMVWAAMICLGLATWIVVGCLVASLLRL